MSRLVHDEFVGSGFDSQAEVAAFQERAIVQQVDQSRDAPAFFVELAIAPRGADGQHRERYDDGDDHEHHQDLDQREALVAHALALPCAAPIYWKEWENRGWWC